MFQMSKDFWSKKNCILRWFRHFTYLSMNIYEYQSWILKNVEKQGRRGFRCLSARYPVCGKGCEKVLDFPRTLLTLHLQTFDR